MRSKDIPGEARRREEKPGGFRRHQGEPGIITSREDPRARQKS